MKENTSLHTPEVLRDFARALNAPIRRGRVDIPQKFGSGYCMGITFNPYIRMLLLNYSLKKDIVLTNTDRDINSQLILFKFQDVLPDTVRKSPCSPSVLIATRDVRPDVTMPIHTHIATINIEIDAAYLAGILVRENQSFVVSSLLKNAEPLFFEQTVFPSIMQIVQEILNEPVTEPFRLFFLRIKAEELVCRLLNELEKRRDKQLRPVNQKDVQALYATRDFILAHLETPPTLSGLATSANMSTSKLKTLFRQIFGKSIYSYYQHFRMQEAARLLAAGDLSVSEVGYRLGFSNLSHFTRVFEEHIGLKPKQFSMQA